MKLTLSNRPESKLQQLSRIWLTAVMLISAGGIMHAQTAQSNNTFQVGEKAQNFSLNNMDGAQVSLSSELAHGPVILVVLRGWPGYQCPFCVRQFGDFLAHAEDFSKKEATVVFVYPGPADNLRQHAKEFEASLPMPKNFQFLVDPDMQWVSAHGLRWQGEKETSYPSTFVIYPSSEVHFAMVTKTHGGRSTSTQVLEALPPSKKK